MSFSKASIVLAVFIVVGCGGAEESPMETDAYNGTVAEVDAEERKIHVEVPDEGSMELAFTDSTQVLKNFLEVPFDSLNADRKVRVEVMETGEEPTPMTVTLLE
jgi:hypothetical protein